MDKSRFTTNSPGKVVEITTAVGKDWAFIPDDLPAKWQFDPKLWPLLVEAREALGTLNGIGQTLTDPRLLLRPLQNREAITSSSIEGTDVTAEQLLLFELNPTESKKPQDRIADWIEVHNYGKALTVGCDLLTKMPLCNRLIKTMHSNLMEGVRGKTKAPGEFRNCQVQLGHDARFVPPPANEVQPLMGNLELYINRKGETFDPLVRCFIVHYQFEAIHPFRDGNGRIGRALLALMIYHWLGHSSPWLYMSSFFEKYKDEYVNFLYKISTTKSWGAWIEFCLRGVVQQSKDAVRRCNEFNRLRREFHDTIKSPSPRTHKIIEGLFIDPLITISSVAERCGITYPTAKTDVKTLVDAGILVELGNHYPKTFYSKKVFNTAYEGQVRNEKEGESKEN